MTGSYSGNFRAVLDEWVSDMRQDVQDALRPAAQAGAQVLYEAVKLNVPRSKKGHWFHGTSFRINGKKYWFDANTLMNSIYQVHSKDNSDVNKHTYHVSWNHKECPYGFMVEYGTVRANPVAFVRNATSRMPQALEAAEQKFFQQLKHFK